MTTTVTRLQPTKRDPARVMIRVGAKVAATLPRSAVDELGIAAGTPWTPALAAAVAEAVDADKARRYALNALGRRALSRGELVERIRRRGHGDEVARRVVDDLGSRGLVDDLAYARAVIRSERARKPAGPALLRAKLMHKRVDRQTIDAAIAEADDGYDQVEAARQLIERRLRTTAMRRADPPTRQRRLWALLARRGFSVDIIRAAIKAMAESST